MKIKQKDYSNYSEDINISESSFEGDSFSTLNFDSAAISESDNGTETLAEINQVNNDIKKDRVPEEHLRLLHVYFKDMGFESLLTAKDELRIAAKIRQCEDRIQELAESIEQLRALESGLKPGSPRRDELNQRVENMLVLTRSLNRSSQNFKQRFIRSNLRLVITISRRYMTRGLPLTDLIQEGNMGLMRAVDRFDHTKGFKFSTYASWWINQAIQRAVQEQTRTIKVPVYLLEKANIVYKSSTRLAKELGRRPTYREIADESGISVEVVKKILTSANDAVSLDKPIFDNEQTSLIDSVYDRDAVISDSVLAKKSLSEKLEEALAFLNPREEEIIRLRFGIGLNSTYTLDEIGKRFNLTRERIRQIEKVALSKLANSEIKDHLKSFLKNF